MPPSSVPIIGLLGGIASGKSHYARELQHLGCPVISADDLVSELYRRPEILQTLSQWWGPQVLLPDGTLNRPAVASLIFSDSTQRARLESLLHPHILSLCHDRTTAASRRNPPPPAIVWDIPLLRETHLDRHCSLLVFVDTPDLLRQSRAAARGWPPGQLAQRELAQLPLTEKRQLAHLIVPGDAPQDAVHHHARQIVANVEP